MPHCVSAFKEWPKAAPEAEETEGGGRTGRGEGEADRTCGMGRVQQCQTDGDEWHWLRRQIEDQR